MPERGPNMDVWGLKYNNIYTYRVFQNTLLKIQGEYPAKIRLKVSNINDIIKFFENTENCCLEILKIRHLTVKKILRDIEMEIFNISLKVDLETKNIDI